MRRFAILLVLCAFSAACETIKGVGRDIENTGEAIDDAVSS
jgi:predicted small secreted protein